MAVTATGLDRAAAFFDRVARLNAQYRAAEIRAHVPAQLRDGEQSLETLVARLFPVSRSMPRPTACSTRCRSRSIQPNQSARTWR